MYKREFTPPHKHYFLFGPRSTGKSTWLRQRYPNALTFNLLRTTEMLHYTQKPDDFAASVRASKENIVVVDEIQRLPALLSEVHDLITELGAKKQFVLTGSSARKLKREGVDLLAGRALTRSFFPLVSAEFEFKAANLENILRFGTLPEVRASESEDMQGETLEAYADTYLKEEIKQEALVRNLDPFSRFLRVAAVMNGQRLNLSNLAREAEVKRPSVDGYFDVLTDTLIAYKLPAWQPRAKVKEVALPKFYFFDPGVVRALSGKLWSPLDGVEKGFLFETFLLNEIRAYAAYRSVRGNFYYWATPSESEVDLVFVKPAEAIGFEFKSENRWRSDDHRTLAELVASRKLKHAWGVYTGRESFRYGAVEVLPVADFLRRLWTGEIL